MWGVQQGVQFFVKWGKWFFPRETISTMSECLVKKGQLGLLGLQSCCTEDGLPVSSAQFPNQGSGEPGDPTHVPLLSDCDICITQDPSVPHGAHSSWLSQTHCLGWGCPCRVTHTCNPLPSQEGKQEGSLYPVFTLTRFDSMLEAALLIGIVGLAGRHSWVHEVLSGGPVVQAEPQTRAVARGKQLSCWGAAGQELRGSGWVGSRGAAPAGDTTLLRGSPDMQGTPAPQHECEPLGRKGRSILTPGSW